MKRRIWSALTSIFLVTLVALALIFVPFEASSDVDEFNTESLSSFETETAHNTMPSGTFSYNGEYSERSIVPEPGTSGVTPFGEIPFGSPFSNSPYGDSPDSGEDASSFGSPELA